MSRVEIEFSRHRDDNSIELVDYDRFKPVLYSNLFVPSYVHSYSLAIEYMKRWFLERFENNEGRKEDIRNGKDSNFFKYVHINGKHMFDDYKRFNKQNVKREKPLCIITPNVETDYNRENLDLYNAGAEIFLRRSNFQKSFFKDYDSKLFLGLQMQELKMQFNFRVKVSTKAQQLDLLEKMKLYFRVGGSSTEYKTGDFVIPKDILLNIAHDKGFTIKDNDIVDTIGFLQYLNSHSQVPILYRLRNITNKIEYYMRISPIVCNIRNLDQLQIDDGETEGQLQNNFNIDMQTELRISVPHFFIYFNETPLTYEFKTDNPGGIGLYTFSQFLINPKNKQGWDTFMNTVYQVDPNQDTIDFGEVFRGTSLHKVILDSIENFISPTSFIDIKVYKESAGEYPEIYSEMDYGSLHLKIQPQPQEEYLYIVVYIDKLYYNIQLEKLTKLSDNNRIQ